MSISKRVSEMTAEERLTSLRQWAEEQKYVTPGDCGTLNTHGRLYNNAQSAYEGPVKLMHHQYSAPIAPPSYETVIAETAKKEKKAGLVKKLFANKKREVNGNEVR